jgi:hypothetical protein
MTAELLEQCAQAAYEAGMNLRHDKEQRMHPWASLPDYWKRIYRAQATAILNILQPPPDVPLPADPDTPLFDLEGTTP